MAIQIPAAFNTASLSYSGWRTEQPVSASAPVMADVSAPVSGGITPTAAPDGALPFLTLYDPNGKTKTMYFAPGSGGPGPNGLGEDKGGSKAEMAQKAMGGQPCERCKNRKYQDASNDAGVSFKAPGHIAPEASAAVVAGHERQHVTAAYSKAGMKDQRVVQASVRLFTSSCPECGRNYVSGGVTQVRVANKSNANTNSNSFSENLLGLYIDEAV